MTYKLKLIKRLSHFVTVIKYEAEGLTAQQCLKILKDNLNSNLDVDISIQTEE